MKTRRPITHHILGTSLRYTVPVGVRCDRAHNLPLDKNGRFQYWARGWKGVGGDAKEALRSIGILLTVDEILNGN